MARTKRASQSSANAKNRVPTPVPCGSPEAYDAESSSPPSPTPGQRSGVAKRKARDDSGSSPAKKKSKPILVDSDDDELDAKSASSATLDSSADAGGTPEVVGAEDSEEEEEMETPKASKINQKSNVPKKTGNLKTALGGSVGVNTVDDVISISALNGPIADLPSSAFTVENKHQWAASCYEQAKTYLYVKARSTDDPLLANKDILDPYLSKRGYYKGLPNANSLQLLSANETQSAKFTNGSLTSLVPGLSMESWDVLGVDLTYIASLLRFKRQGIYANPSTIDVVDLVFKESYSSQGAGNAYIACHRDDSRPAVFASLGGIMSSFLSEGKSIGFEGRGPFTKGVEMVQHRVEYERMSCLIATLWHGDELQAPVKRRHITYQTMNRKNNADDNEPLPPNGTGSKVGKMTLTHYESPSKRYVPKNRTSLDFKDAVPVYDGRNGVFDCNSFASSLAALHPYPLDRDSQFEIPEGSGCLVGYTVSTSKYLSTWRLTFHLLWVIVLAD